MNQKQLIDAICHIAETPSDRHIQKQEAEAVLRALGTIASQELRTQDGEVSLPGIGKLKAATRAARSGRNPKTGETINIPARRVVTFKPAASLAEAVRE